MSHVLGVGLLLLHLSSGARMGRSGRARDHVEEAESGALGIQRLSGVGGAIARFDAESLRQADSTGISLTSARFPGSLGREVLARRSATELFRRLEEPNDAPPFSHTDGAHAGGSSAESSGSRVRLAGDLAGLGNGERSEFGDGMGPAEPAACRGNLNCFGHGSHFMRKCSDFCSADQNCSAHKWMSDPPKCVTFTAGECPTGMQQGRAGPRAVTGRIPGAAWHCSEKAAGPLPKFGAPTPTATPGSHLRQGHLKANYSLLPIAIAVQLHNPTVWKHLRSCVANVVAAAQAMPEQRVSVDLYVALTRPQPSFEDEVRRIPGVADVKTAVVKNRGADIGEFLQQLPEIRRGHYGAMLKLHSKSDPQWRHQALSSLCGSAERVQQVLRMFGENPKLGIVGPSEMIWGWNVDTPTFRNHGPDGSGFRFSGMEQHIAEAWKIIYPRDRLPERSSYLIAAGSIFWLRPDPLLSDSALMSAIPAILDAFPEGWDHEFKMKYRLVHAMERVIPTMIRARYGLDFAEAPPFTLK